MAAEVRISSGSAVARDSIQVFWNRTCLSLRPHREADNILVVKIAAETRVDDERRAVEAAAAFAQQKERGVRDFVGREVAFSERELLGVKIALEVAWNACRRARLERTGADDVEAHLGIGTKRFGQKPRGRFERG